MWAARYMQLPDVCLTRCAQSSAVLELTRFAPCRPATETHEIAERKQKELERLREAWGIQEDTVEGAAFDQDLQVHAQLTGPSLAVTATELAFE